MIVMPRAIGEIRKNNAQLVSPRIAILKQKIDNEDYLNEAIQRIAQVLSNEILELPYGGSYHEWQCKRRK
jgi:GMP synthase PP-ATPase subunit